MKEKVLYDPKNDCIWLAQKDQRDFIRGKWQQTWWIYNGEICMRPSSTDKAKMFTSNMIELESANYLDTYQ